MKEITGDIRNYLAQGYWVVVSTNSAVDRYGNCVMGRGIAYYAKLSYPKLPSILGSMIKASGSKVRLFYTYKLIIFPVKHLWSEHANIYLVRESTKTLAEMWSGNNENIYLPRVGCGSGKLKWERVKSILEQYLDDKFTVVSLLSDQQKDSVEVNI